MEQLLIKVAKTCQYLRILSIYHIYGIFQSALLILQLRESDERCVNNESMPLKKTGRCSQSVKIHWIDLL